MSARGERAQIAVVDYGMGNRRSVQKAFEHVGADASITRDPDELMAADGLVVPGVGAFPLAMRNLHELGLSRLILTAVRSHKPLLGVCLGMQLLFDRSEELGETAGLGLIAGTVTPLRAADLRVPHIGWNEVRFKQASPLTAGLPQHGCPFYHVHSLVVRPDDPTVVVGSTAYGEEFATIVASGIVFGVQFHPEKSSRHGLRMLENFVAISRRAASAQSPPAAARA